LALDNPPARIEKIAAYWRLSFPKFGYRPPRFHNHFRARLSRGQLSVTTPSTGEARMASEIQN
jgi:hypothetical protein